jgi:hypothetical protein
MRLETFGAPHKKSMARSVDYPTLPTCEQTLTVDRQTPHEAGTRDGRREDHKMAVAGLPRVQPCTRWGPPASAVTHKSRPLLAGTRFQGRGLPDRQHTKLHDA